MKLAVNYSPALVELLAENKIEIDLIKCPDWEWMITEVEGIKPLTVHFDLTLGLGQIANTDFERIALLQKHTSTPHINAHLANPTDFVNPTRADINRLQSVWQQELALLGDAFGLDFVVLEHYPYTPQTPHLAYATRADVYADVIRRSGCQVLLDLAHARITANTLGLSLQDYLSPVPMDRLREIHVTGIQLHEGILTDHFGMEAEAWEGFDWALQNIRAGAWRTPEVIAFEYGGVGDPFSWRTEKSVLESDVPRLFQMIHHP